MSEVLGAAAGSADELAKEIARVDAMARGDTGGIESILYTRARIKALEEQAKDAAEQAEKGKANNPYTAAHAAFTKAAVRDAEYGCRGRKYMRTLALTGKSAAAVGRIVSYVHIEENLKKNS